jgi:uncharacterized protein YecA (UPF0149 family)
MSEMPRQPHNTPDALAPLDTPMELVCGACGKKGKYHVGRLLLDPEVIANKDPGMFDNAFGFTRYFHCKKCGAGGPWALTPRSQMMILALVVEARATPEQARIHLAKLVMFDGTTSRWPTQAEAHLKGLLEKSPDDYFVWSRLGNVYKIADVPDLAIDAYREAVKRNDHDIESWHSIAEIHLKREEPEEAAASLHQVLVHAKHAPPRTPASFVRELVRDALETLLDLHLKSEKRIPFFPEAQPAAPSASGEPPVVFLTNFDLSDERDWERLVDWWVTGKPPTPKGKPRASLWTKPRKPSAASDAVGRNSPCRCGSGKKFKNCCMRS